MEIFELEVEKREGAGKSYCKKIRKEGITPAVIYGKGREPEPVQIKNRNLEKILRTRGGENVLLNLVFAEKKSEQKTAMIQDIQKELLKPGIIHLDLKRISLEEKTRVKVPINITAEPKDGRGKGILEHVLWEVEVECLPFFIPNSIDIDLLGLKLGESVKIADLKVPEGIEIIADPSEIVIHYSESRQEEKKEGEEPLFPVDKSEPEVIGKGREDGVSES